MGSFRGNKASQTYTKSGSTGRQGITLGSSGTSMSSPGSQPFMIRQSETTKRHTHPTGADPKLLKKNTELTNKVAELEDTLVNLEKERDFYFQKLRDVEMMLQVHQEKLGEDSTHETSLLDNVFKILYATTEDPVVVTAEGEVRVILL